MEIINNMIKLCWRLVFILTLVSSCTTVHQGEKLNIDPYEKYNRTIFDFNMKVDDYILYPLAKTYTTLCPWPLREGATHFFQNLRQVTVIANDILQAETSQTLSDVWRFFFNSTFGIGGLFDVATPLGLKQHNTDFGITLGKWGYHKSIYLMVPFFGPGTVRDVSSWMVDYYGFSVWPYLEPWKLRVSMLTLDTINSRANLLGTEKIVKDAFDPYVFMRDTYLQQRTALIAGKNIDNYPNEKLNQASPIMPAAAKDASLNEEEEWALSHNTVHFHQSSNKATV